MDPVFFKRPEFSILCGKSLAILLTKKKAERGKVLHSRLINPSLPQPLLELSCAMAFS